jgi:REP element-mobilizing transposase RayT
MENDTYEENEFPLAYLITFRTFGTWLHGDDRESVGRDGRNHFGKAHIKPNPQFASAMKKEMDQPPFILTKPMRRIVESSIKELCERRDYTLFAVNVRSNHAHTVVFAQMKPERIADALKANATKMLRERSLISANTRVWSRGRSRRYLWKPWHLSGAIDYVLYCQSDVPFDLVDQ